MGTSCARLVPLVRYHVADDPTTSERFIRVVGKRRPPPAGAPPTLAARQAMSQMARYRTRAPKGVFIYASHEQANRDREAWLVDAMLSMHQDG
jgi:hypothetical protein